MTNWEQRALEAEARVKELERQLPVIKFWAVFVDETGYGEFGAPIEAHTRGEAWEIAREDYPESRCVQLESPDDTREREHAMYARIEREQGYDCDDDYDYDCDDFQENYE